MGCVRILFEETICVYLPLAIFDFKWHGRINYKIFRQRVSNLNSSVETPTQ